MRLVFTRFLKGSDCSDYYETKTNVYVFGDLPGYQRFAKLLRLAEKAPQTIPPASRSHGMNCVILPACKKLGNASRIKFIERLVYLDRQPRMELVIYGTPKAYRYLARELLALSGYAPDSGDYLGLDDQNSPKGISVIPRSIALTIRPPVPSDYRSIFGLYRDRAKNNPDEFPDCIEEMKAYRKHEEPEYEPITADSDFLKLRSVTFPRYLAALKV